MREKVRIAGIGGWHVHAKDFTGRVMKYPGAEMAAVWDNDKTRGEEWARECGCPFVADLDDVMSDADIDAVTITCETTLHYEMIVKAARAGKHIYVEKPPFMHADEAYEARKVIEKSGVKFMIGSPIVKPMHLKTQELLAAGVLGDIVGLRYRTVHELALLGTQKDSFFRRDANGGGAMMDMGNHALHLLSWFAGAPKRTEAVYTSWSQKAEQNQVDDNDIAVIEFQNGILGTIETGWVSPWYQYGFDLYGTKGSVSCRAYEMFICLEDGIWRKVPEEELPAPETYPLHYWIDCIREGKSIERDNIDVAVLMTEMSDQVEEAAEVPLRPVACSAKNERKKPDLNNSLIDSRVWEKAKKITGSGELGEIQCVRVHCCGEEELADMEGRALNLLISILGEPTGEKKLVSTSGVRKGENSVCLLTFGGKRLGIVEVCRRIPEYENAIDICATHGWLRIRGGHLSYTTTEPGDRNAIWKDVEVKTNAF